MATILVFGLGNSIPSILLCFVMTVNGIGEDRKFSLYGRILKVWRVADSENVCDTRKDFKELITTIDNEYIGGMETCKYNMRFDS